MSVKTLRITQTKSANGRLASHKGCLRGLGLRRIHHVVVREDTAAVRGMIAKVAYMVSVEQD